MSGMVPRWLSWRRIPRRPPAARTRTSPRKLSRATIEKYNSYVASQNDPGTSARKCLPAAIDIDAIEADPNRGFVISPRKASLHHTMGGVKIDSEAHVLNANGEAISGLWAAGEVTGGVHAGNRLGRQR